MQNNKFISTLIGNLKAINFTPTRTKLTLFAVTLIAVGFALGGLENGLENTLDNQTVAARVINLSIPERHEFQATSAENIEALPATGNIASPVDSALWDGVTVKPGQSLDSIFKQQGFSSRTLFDIMALSNDTKQLKNIRPGDLFEFQHHEDGGLKRMRYAVDEANYLIIDSDGQQFSASTEARDLITRVEETSGTITSSLFAAGKQAGLNDGMVMKLAELFGWDIDFVLDIREGDQFHLIYEKIYRDGDFLRDGEIIGATFVNQGEKFQAIRFDIDGQAQYFAADGHNVRKAFLRAPLNFSYISSNFNPKRFHPILKRIKPHRGIDYRAPKGTPVYTVGDGKVIKAAYDRFNGNHVFIQHANSIVTKYLHFTKRAVKNGQRVKQGQVIGYVGSTGMSQAPHVHFEFVVNGVHRNPRTVPLPKAEALKGTQLNAFKLASAATLTQLSRLESASMYASQ